MGLLSAGRMESVDKAIEGLRRYLSGQRYQQRARQTVRQRRPIKKGKVKLMKDIRLKELIHSC
ncbi:MAG: hypothetical protein M1351_02730 [Candidatus Thermoplasmatota archaeon]|nr:hypothetical protein [Candidatus Thermoplasmatota archaeon]